MCTTCMLGAHEGQNRTSDPLQLELQMLVSDLLCVYWESNPEPLEEHQSS